MQRIARHLLDALIGGLAGGLVGFTVGRWLIRSWGPSSSPEEDALIAYMVGFVTVAAGLVAGVSTRLITERQGSRASLHSAVATAWEVGAVTGAVLGGAIVFVWGLLTGTDGQLLLGVGAIGVITGILGSLAGIAVGLIHALRTGARNQK